MYLFIHAAQRENASLMLVGKSMPRTAMRVKEFNKSKESKKSKELLQFLTFDDLIVFVQRLAFRKSKPTDVLQAVDTALKKFHLLPKDLKGICVLSGPGQFSFLRSSVVVANTFSWAFGIPVVGITSDEFSHEKEFIQKGLEKLSMLSQARRRPREGGGIPARKIRMIVPRYGKEPNITLAKKKI